MNFISSIRQRFSRTGLTLVVLLGLQLTLGLFSGMRPAYSAGPSFVQTQGDRLTLNGQPIVLKGSNFYPLGNSFANMWKFWDAQKVREGLEASARLGNNAVRVMIPFTSEHGWTDPGTGAVVPESLNQLRQFLQIAGELNLRAIVTLFDFAAFPQAGSSEAFRQGRYAQDIVTAFKDDDRILAWDLHNEPDNYTPWSNEDNAEPALAWLGRMRQYVRGLDPNHLITIGVGRRESHYKRGAEGFSTLDLSDFVSYHSYNADALPEELYELQERTGRARPIILEELGWPTGPVFAPDFTEASQLEKYKKTLKAAKDHNLSGAFQWMLYDAEAVGVPPWDDIGNHYGLIMHNGTLKPAAQVWQNDWTATPLPAPATVTNLSLTNVPPRENPPHYFSQTDHYIGTPLWELWRRVGSTEVFGYPLTDTFLAEDVPGGRHDALNDLNKTPIYQYYEKGRFEYHPERRAWPKYKGLEGLDRYFYLVDFGDVGKELAAARGYRFESASRLNESETYQWFSQTSHSLQEPFLTYWRQHYGNRLFGAPISEPFEEANPETGQRRLVQYFEKTRLEYRPEYAPTRSAVVVGNAGAELIKAKGWIDQANLDYSPPAPPSGSTGSNFQANPPGFADPAFETVWRRTDAPVADGAVSRTWLWGQKPLATVREPYAEAPGGSRLVQYFDKSRMELTDPASDRGSKWFVTNGLLVREMITGRVQTGNNSFEPFNPAAIPLAGDPAGSNPDAPTYASLANLTGPAADQTGQAVTAFLVKDGSLAPLPANLAGRARLVTFNSASGHNIGGVFWSFLTGTRGPVVEGGQTVIGDPVDWLFSTGLPITEPYWMRAKVGGVEQEILVQAFERRVLTYTPANPPAFQVEMGNVGGHYLTWRYPGGGAAPASVEQVQAPDAATRAALDGAGRLAYRQLGPTSFYKFGPAAQADSAPALPGAVGGAGTPLPGPGLVYTSTESSGRQAIHLNDLQGRNRLGAYGLSGALSPDGGWLAFVQYSESERADLYLQNGDSPVQVVARDVLPAVAWSADGQKLAFYFKDVNRVRLAVRENGVVRVLGQTPPDTLADGPFFSPDGRWLAFTRMHLTPDERGPRIDASEVRVINLATGEERLVADRASQPAWAADGSALAWLGWNEGGLWRASWQNEQAGPGQRLSQALGCEAECANVGRPAFSPDSRWLAFTGPAHNLLAVSPQGGPVYRLTNPPTDSLQGATDPIWVKN